MGQRRVGLFLIACFPAAILMSVPVPAAADWYGSISSELRVFPERAAYPGQHEEDLSLTLEGEYAHEWEERNEQFVFKPFLRLDQHDPERTHADIRELYWSKAMENWEFGIGINEVFWGVTESQHLVDIINQTDLVEDMDGEEKLGQPMMDLTSIRDWGTLELYLLPGFRERTFPGHSGRFRPPLAVESDEPLYESGAESHHVDWAVRWSHYFGAWDVGLSHFAGTSRDPRLRLRWKPPVNLELVPYYDQINQTGLDLQYSRGGWLWKLEAICRSGQNENFFASTGGFEYTFSGVGGSDVDLGILVEHLYDDRGENRQTPFENDLFLGTRLMFNDLQTTQMLVGGIIDLDSGATFLSLEASRRLGTDWKLSIAARTFAGFQEDDIGYWVRNDDYIQVKLTWYI